MPRGRYRPRVLGSSGLLAILPILFAGRTALAAEGSPAGHPAWAVQPGIVIWEYRENHFHLDVSVGKVPVRFEVHVVVRDKQKKAIYTGTASRKGDLVIVDVAPEPIAPATAWVILVDRDGNASTAKELWPDLAPCGTDASAAGPYVLNPGLPAHGTLVVVVPNATPDFASIFMRAAPAIGSEARLGLARTESNGGTTQLLFLSPTSELTPGKGGLLHFSRLEDLSPSERSLLAGLSHSSVSPSKDSGFAHGPWKGVIEAKTAAGATTRLRFPGERFADLARVHIEGIDPPSVLLPIQSTGDAILGCLRCTGFLRLPPDAEIRGTVALVDSLDRESAPRRFSLHTEGASDDGWSETDWKVVSEAEAPAPALQVPIVEARSRTLSPAVRILLFVGVPFLVSYLAVVLFIRRRRRASLRRSP